ncbi:hypothetical protein HYT01_00275 [Candidatus Giovannonibacteria bacterium]|nr:hypothetical protein [Candidatus Giovannonibacteria bacterium]
MTNKHFWKFFGMLLGLIVLGLAVIFAVDYYNLKGPRDDARRAEELQKELEQKYMADTYGGKTPEETLQLFIDALKAGDTDLAAKYFIIDDQEKWKENLKKIKDNNKLTLMVSDLNRPKEKKALGDSRFTFYIYNDVNQLALAIDIAMGSNGVWKIVEL